MNKSIPEIGLDTQTLERLLRQVQIGETVAYIVLSTAIGRDVQYEAYGNLRSARRRLLKQERIVFAAVTGEGLKRLDDRGKVGAGRAHIKKAHTQAKIARANLTSVDDFDAMPNELKIDHNIGLAMAGAIIHATSPRTEKAIAGKIETAQPKFSPKESFLLIRGV